MDNIGSDYRKRKISSKGNRRASSADNITLNHFGHTIDIQNDVINDACDTATHMASENGYTNGNPQYKEDMIDLISDELSKKQKKS